MGRKRQGMKLEDRIDKYLREQPIRDFLAKCQEAEYDYPSVKVFSVSFGHNRKKH